MQENWKAIAARDKKVKVVIGDRTNERVKLQETGESGLDHCMGARMCGGSET